MVVYRGKDAQIICAGATLGYADSASVDINRNTIQIWQLGSNQPVELSEGNVEISGSIDRAFVDLTVATLVGTLGTSSLPYFTLTFNISTLSGVGAPIVSITDCKVESITQDMSQDGTIMFNMDYVAKGYSITTRA